MSISFEMVPIDADWEILPDFKKFLSSSKIDEKIQEAKRNFIQHSEEWVVVPSLEGKIKKAKRHIEHLNGMLSHPNTHGGERVRARNISVRDQLSMTAKRLKCLELERRT